MELSEKEKKEIVRMSEETAAIWDFMWRDRGNEIKGGKDWMTHAEPLMGLSALHTRNLVNHSIKLNRLTKVLMVLTSVLAVPALADFVRFLNELFHWW